MKIAPNIDLFYSSEPIMFASGYGKIIRAASTGCFACFGVEYFRSVKCCILMSRVQDDLSFQNFLAYAK